MLVSTLLATTQVCGHAIIVSVEGEAHYNTEHCYPYVQGGSILLCIYLLIHHFRDSKVGVHPPSLSPCRRQYSALDCLSVCHFKGGVQQGISQVSDNAMVVYEAHCITSHRYTYAQDGSFLLFITIQYFTSEITKVGCPPT